jgi:hypothetical protein
LDSLRVVFFDGSKTLTNKKAPLTGGGMGAGQASLLYEGIIRQRNI